MDQQRCGGFGYQQGSQAFADCMMSVAQQRQAEQAAADRVAAANAAAQQRQEAAIRAGKDQADQDAWNHRTSSNPISSPDPVDPIRDSITSDMQRIENAGTSQLTQGMNCTTTSTSSGSPNNVATTSHTNCR